MKSLNENYFNGSITAYEAKGKTDERESDMNSETGENKQRRGQVESYFSNPGVDIAQYAYNLYNIEIKKGEDTNDMKNARSKFMKCLNHETNEAGYPYSFTTSEINRLYSIISNNSLNERINKAINESFKNLKKKLNEDIEDDDFNVDDLDWETQQELNYDMHQFNKAAQQANGTYQAASQDGSLKTGDRVAFQTVNGLIDGIIVDFDINPMTGEETADVDYWRRDKAAKWTMLSIPLSKIQKL